MHCVHFWVVIRLAALAIVLAAFAACKSTSQNETGPRVLVYDSASSFEERQKGVQSFAPEHKDFVSVARSSQTSPSASGSTALPSKRENDAVQARLAKGWEELDRGDVSSALETALSVWDELEKRRVHTLDEELGTSPLREAALLLSSVQLRTHQKRDGVRLLERLVRIARDWEAPYVTLATHYADIGALGLAEKVAQAGLERVGEDGPELAMLLARLQWLQGETDKAKQTLRLASLDFPEDGRLEFWDAIFDYELGHYVEACEKFEKVFEEVSEMPAASENLALCYIKKGETEKAEAVLKPAIASFPRSAKHKLLLGVALQKRGKDSDARKAFVDFLELAGERDNNRAIVEAMLREGRVPPSDGFELRPVAP